MLNFIYNPTAGSGRAKRAYNYVFEALKDSNIEHKFHETAARANATEVARTLTENGETDIIVLGGDGTLHEVLNGLADPSKVNLGLIPCGSGNDFASSAKIPVDPEKALNIILNGNTNYVDYMVCDGIRGMNVMGTGIDVEILERCYKSKILKGKFKYALSLLVSVIDYKCRNIKIEKDDKTEPHRYFILSVANGKKFGGGIKIAPEAEINDGLLEVILVNNMPWLKRPIAIGKLAMGKIHTLKQTEYTKATKVKGLFDEPTDIELDGEVYPNLKFDVHVVHNELKMFLP